MRKQLAKAPTAATGPQGHAARSANRPAGKATAAATDTAGRPAPPGSMHARWALAPAAPAKAAAAQQPQPTHVQADTAAEQGADRAAAQLPQRHASGPAGAATGIAGVQPGQANQPLSRADRAFFEPHLQHDFSRVQVHADSRAAGMADALNAQAFTVGRDVYLGSAALRNDKAAGDRLLGHELAHVAQQAKAGPALQPKLNFSGDGMDVARAIALLNTGLRGFRASIDKAGNVKLTPNFVDLPPDSQQQALADNLAKVIDDPKDVLMTVSSGTKTLGGSYATGDFDIADLEVYGVPGLIHEIVEQHAKQTTGAAFGNDTSGAHSVAMQAESQVRGAVRGAQKMVSKTVNGDGTLDAVVEIPHTFPDGKVKTMVMTIDHNNIKSVAWK